MGESVAEATIIKWSKSIGDRIEMDDIVMEIATDKVDSEVPSPVSGKLVKQLYNENDVVQVGSAIAVIDTADANEPAPQNNPVVIAPPQPAPQRQPAVQQAAPVAAEPQYTPPFVDQIQQPRPAPAQAPAGTRFYSPLVKNIAIQEKVTPHELDAIPGSGADGRLTKDDLLAYVKERANRPLVAKPIPQPVAAQPNIVQQQQAEPQPVQVAPPAVQPARVQPSVQQEAVPQPVVMQPQSNQPQPVQQVALPPQPQNNQQPIAQQNTTVQAVQPQRPAVSLNPGDEVIEMDRMRRLIADHMVMSVHTSPHVTSFIEADVTNMVLWREKIKASFEARENTKITFTPLFIEAVARAIKDMPMINVSVNGTQIIKRKDINIGMATALPSGNLIVPVIRRADQLNIVGLTQTVNDLSARARTNKLTPDEVKNGTFTITNIGSFGNLMGTPIINQPQVAILAVGAIKKKPAVIQTAEGDVIAIRHMMYLSLSYDHRVVDGSLGGMFIQRVANYLENWDINRGV
ncbi:dihydrolipoamide acetyltransferase family protein [Mucilaginibacter gracilis]|nr:dihydrolipoamide acetyltransferase family protein [Mucilaginibacter gracilis]